MDQSGTHLATRSSPAPSSGASLAGATSTHARTAARAAAESFIPEGAWAQGGLCAAAEKLWATCKDARAVGSCFLGLLHKSSEAPHGHATAPDTHQWRFYASYCSGYRSWGWVFQEAIKNICMRTKSSRALQNVAECGSGPTWAHLAAGRPFAPSRGASTLAALAAAAWACLACMAWIFL